MIVDGATTEDCFTGAIVATPGDGECCRPPLADDDIKNQVETLFEDWMDLYDDIQRWYEDLEAHRPSSRFPSIARRVLSLCEFQVISLYFIGLYESRMLV